MSMLSSSGQPHEREACRKSAELIPGESAHEKNTGEEYWRRVTLREFPNHFLEDRWYEHDDGQWSTGVD